MNTKNKMINHQLNANYQLTEAELISALKIHSRGSKNALIVMSIILVILLLIGIFTEYKAVSFGAVIGGVLTYILILTVILPFNAKKQFKQNRGLRDETTMQSHSEGINFKSEMGESKLQWQDIHQWKFSQHVFLLYITSALFYVVPERAINDKEAFESVLTTHIGNKKT